MSFSSRQFASLVVVFGALGATAVACGLDAGGLAGTGDGAGSDAAVSMDSGSGVVPPSDAGSITPPRDAGSPPPVGDDSGPVEAAPPGNDGCASAEICDNGIDDNCNGLVDCADPACAAWTCLAAAIPAGWSVVELDTSASSACASTYPKATAYYGGTFPPAMCSCTSELTTPGSCTNGAIEITAGPGCATIDAGATGQSGACVALGSSHEFTPPPGTQIAVAPAPYAAGTCTTKPTATIPPVTPLGQICQAGESVGMGCTNGGSCVPAIATDAKVCILHDVTVACPTGIGFDHVQAVYRQMTDARGCTACTATPPTATCASPELSFYTDPACSEGAASINANGACVPFPPPPGGDPTPTYESIRYTATVAGETCTAPAVSPTGTVTLSDGVTLCCQ